MIRLLISTLMVHSGYMTEPLRKLLSSTVYAAYVIILEYWLSIFRVHSLSSDDVLNRSE